MTDPASLPSLHICVPASDDWPPPGEGNNLTYAESDDLGFWPHTGIERIRYKSKVEYVFVENFRTLFLRKLLM